MQTHNLGYPRIGSQRELKKACEAFWSGKISEAELLATGKQLRQKHWAQQHETGIDLIPVNDFSFYDQVLDMSMTVGAIPDRYYPVILNNAESELELYFAMARGYQKNGLDITAMEMTKWFDTNYHYIVPEFHRNQSFRLFSSKIISEFDEARSLNINAKPVIIGPVSYLLLGKEKETGFSRLELIKNLLPVYLELITQLVSYKVEWIQFDEPFLTMDLDETTQTVFHETYSAIRKAFPSLKIMVATYFGDLGDNTSLSLSLPVNALHLDLVRAPEQLKAVLNGISSKMELSLGIVDGRNIWKNNFQESVNSIRTVIDQIGEERVWIAPSCSLLHVPVDLELETNEQTLPAEIKQWMAFARQKTAEIVALKHIISDPGSSVYQQILQENAALMKARESSTFIHNNWIKERVKAIRDKDYNRNKPFALRKELQQQALKLPLFPTTTIGSFPQTTEVRSWRARFKKGDLTLEAYEQLLRNETETSIRWQEATGLDVLVHGEFERNDMVEYFGEQLDGFAFTQNGWVQSYGSRCVKPPVIYGDVSRPAPMTVRWSTYAQSLTSKWVKGMLTGPVTILQWSFVRNDQPRSETCLQIALAIRDEVTDLEQAGIRIIQIDEPAIREGLPLRRSQWNAYLEWAVNAFRLSAAGVKDQTQIHTHMCYSEFNDIIEHIAQMDADVITIECSRSQMELLDAFADFHYPNDIGPGVYDIHSPRVPSNEEMVALMNRAVQVIPASQLWINPDCGLKTRHWEETRKALTEMVLAAGKMRKTVQETALHH